MIFLHLCVGVFFVNGVFKVTAASDEGLQSETFLQLNLTTQKNTTKSTISSIKTHKWVSELMDEAKTVFNVDSANSNKCKEDFQLYKLHLLNQSIWAVRMLESSEWPYYGIYSGKIHSLGNYEECLLVSAYGVKGQYCLVSATYEKTDKPKKSNPFEWPDERASIWDALEKYKRMPWKVSRQTLHWAVCVPESCTPKDVTLSLNRTLNSVFKPEGYHVEATVQPKLCTNQNKAKFSFGFYAFWTYITFVIILMIVGTAYDCYTTNTSEKPENQNQKFNLLGLTKCYSIIYNVKQLTRKSSDSSTVHLLKICYLIGVLWGHRTLVHLGNPSFNREGIELETVTQDHVSLNLRTIFVIDIFNVMSGFFCYYHDFTKIRKLGSNFAVVNVFIRWTRLVPVLAIIMLFVINVLPYLNDGPYWNYRIGNEAENCIYTFWYNIFGVSNQFGTDKTCIVISWYISLDLQLTLIGSILLVLMAKNKKFGIFLSVVVFLLSSFASSIIVYLKKYHALLPAYGHFLENPAKSDDFSKFYIATYQRLPFYLMGFGAAMITKYVKKKNYKASNIEVFLLLTLGLLVKGSTLVYVGRLFDFVEPYDNIKHAWNTHLPRLICFIPDCYAMILCFSSDLAILTKVLEHHIFTVIGRLMYSFFVVHVVLQLYHSSSSTVLAPYANTPMLWTLVADVVLTLVAAFVLHLLIEAPIANFVKVTLGMVYGGKRPETNQEKSNPNENNGTYPMEKTGGTKPSC